MGAINNRSIVNIVLCYLMLGINALIISLIMYRKRYINIPNYKNLDFLHVKLNDLVLYSSFSECKSELKTPYSKYTQFLVKNKNDEYLKESKIKRKEYVIKQYMLKQ